MTYYLHCSKFNVYTSKIKYYPDLEYENNDKNEWNICAFFKNVVFKWLQIRFITLL